MSERLAWVKACGKGKIYSYTIVWNAPSGAFAGDVPYVVALVELAEGVRMMTNIVDCDPKRLRCDLPVQVVFRQREQLKLPMFAPVPDDPAG
jgi:hypothetical protein